MLFFFFFSCFVRLFLHQKDRQNVVLIFWFVNLILLYSTNAINRFFSALRHCWYWFCSFFVFGHSNSSRLISIVFPFTSIEWFFIYRNQANSMKYIIFLLLYFYFIWQFVNQYVYQYINDLNNGPVWEEKTAVKSNINNFTRNKTSRRDALHLKSDWTVIVSSNWQLTFDLFVLFVFFFLFEF